MRTAAVADFLQDLRARGAADLNAVCTTLNEGSLVRETLGHWLENDWIVIAPNSRLQALAGSAFSRQLTLEQFCGAGEEGAKGFEEGSGDEEAPGKDENS